jgi:hypothetical protein
MYGSYSLKNKFILSLSCFVFFFTACHKEKEIVGKWQIVDVQIEEVDTIGLAGFIFTTLSEHLPRPTTLIVKADTLSMFSDNQKLVSNVWVLLSEEKNTYFLRVDGSEAKFVREEGGRGVFTVDGMKYLLKQQ